MNDKYEHALLQRAEDEDGQPVAPVADAGLAKLPVELAPGAFRSEMGPRPAPAPAPRPR